MVKMNSKEIGGGERTQEKNQGRGESGVHWKVEFQLYLYNNIGIEHQDTGSESPF